MSSRSCAAGDLGLKRDEAFNAYEAVRNRLPDVTRSAPCHNVRNLDAISDSFDVFLLDAFGVLNIGETAIPEVPERVANLQSQGKRVMVVSNAAGYPHDNLMQKYKRLGYNFDPDDVITSRKTTLSLLPKMRFGLMANKDFGRGDLEDIDATFLDLNPQTFDAAEAFLLLGSGYWTEEHQSLVEASLTKNPRPVFVGNPDIVAPREEGFSTEPGSFAHRLADVTGVEPQFFGKPFRNIFDLAFARLDDIDPSRVVMVGDSLHTDILGGQEAGIKTALIAGYGFFGGADVTAPIASSGIEPDYILERP